MKTNVTLDKMNKIRTLGPWRVLLSIAITKLILLGVNYTLFT